VYPVLVSNLISERGVRAAMRVLGCIQLGVLIPATCLIKRFLPLDKDRKINLDTPAFKEHKFRKLFAMCGVFFMGFTVVIFFLPSYTISLGFTKAQGSLALTAKHCQTLHAHTLTALHAHTLPALPALHAHILPALLAYTLPTQHAHTLQTLHAHTLQTLHAYTLPTLHAHILPALHAHTLPALHARALPTQHAHTLPALHAHTLPTLHAHALSNTTNTACSQQRPCLCMVRWCVCAATAIGTEATAGHSGAGGQQRRRP
jgi:hypothetical protein